MLAAMPSPTRAPIPGPCRPTLDTAPFNQQCGTADVIIDASASVAVSRHLADVTNVTARRACVFFNPTGSSVVVMTENAERTITLRDLEAQYHRLVLTEPSLANHLKAGPDGVRYSASCRALTNRIPATKRRCSARLRRGGLLTAFQIRALPSKSGLTATTDKFMSSNTLRPVVHHVDAETWMISYGDDVLGDLARLRESKLPNETGGILLGIADMSRKSIHIAYALPQPLDSEGTKAGFERGVVGVLDEVNRVVESSMHQLRYVGEWHSHPRQSSAWPSVIDLSQLAWLDSELAIEGLPGLMAIAADDGNYSIILSRRDGQPPPVSPKRTQGAADMDSVGNHRPSRIVRSQSRARRFSDRWKSR